MKTLTTAEKIKYEKIQDNIFDFLRKENYIVFECDYSKLKELVDYSKYLNKINNQTLESYDSIKSFPCKDLESGELVIVDLKPNKENTTKFIFCLLVLESQYAPRQIYRKLIEKLRNNEIK